MPYFGAFKKTNNSLLDPMITRNGYGGPLVDAPGTARTIYYTFEAAKNGYSSLRPGTPTTLSSTEQAMVKKVFAQLSAAADVRFVQGARYISPLHKAQDQWGYVDQNKVAPAYDIALHGTAKGYMGGDGEAVPDLRTKAADGGFIGERVIFTKGALAEMGIYLALHEIGHAMGLKHPGQYSGGFSSGPFLPKGYDSTAYTVMSYNGSTGVSAYGSLDKKALSYIYGAKGSDVRIISSGYIVKDTDFDDIYTGLASGRGINYHGYKGHDYVTGSNFNDTLYGDAGDDRVFGRDGNDVLNGNDGWDMLDGGNGNDTLYGGGGETADILKGGAGNDVVYASIAGDSIEGGLGADTIYAQAGDDSIWAGGDNDVVYADHSLDSGKDLVYGGLGADRIYTYGGNDTVYGGDNQAGVGDGNDVIYLGAGDDIAYGGEGGDTVYGDVGADTLEGGAGADQLNGGEGSDTLAGGAGDDTLAGGSGMDSVNGGEGADVLLMSPLDTLTGGTGDDRFVFDAGVTDSVFSYMTQAYTITDFEGAGAVGGDVLRIVSGGAIMDGSSNAVTNAADFAALAQVSGSNTTILYYVGSTQHMLTLTGVTTLTAGDIDFS